MNYKMEIIRKSDGSISWSMSFENNESNADREKTISVAKNFLDALQVLEVRNDTPDSKYQQLTTFQKGMLFSGESLTGNLR